jgi:hypothetical protein
MKFDIKARLAKLGESLPPMRVAMLRSEAFFCRLIDVPAGTQASDVGGLAQLELESRAPFPVENLAWGFVTSGGAALVFAATQERASAGLEKGLDPLRFALPAFLPFCLETPHSESAVSICVCGDSASALFFDAGKSLPSKIVSCGLPEGVRSDDYAALLKARPAILEKLGVAREKWLSEEIRVLRKGVDAGEEKVVFKIGIVAPSRVAESEAVISGDALWNADVRGRTFAASARASRRRDFFAWMAFASAGCVLAAAFIALLASSAFSIAARVYRSEAGASRDEVEELQNKADFASSLEAATERELKPFSMIAAANMKRPHGLCFDKVSSSDWNILRIEGRAERAEVVQTYIEELGKDANVREVRTLRTASSGGLATYDIEVVFKPLEDISTGGASPAKEGK